MSEIKFILQPGAKIGRTPIQRQPETIEKHGYGSFGAFIQRQDGPDKETLFFLTNGHVVDWKIGQDVYCYQQFGQQWKSKKIGKVSKSTSTADLKEGLDAAAVKIDKKFEWEMKFPINGESRISGTRDPELFEEICTFGARSGRVIDDAKIIDTCHSTNVKGYDAKDMIKISYKTAKNDKGDSGSVIYSRIDNKVVGLFFLMDTHITIDYGYACNIQKVLDFLSKGGSAFKLKTKR